MTIDIHQLIVPAIEHLDALAYSLPYRNRIVSHWEKLANWFDANNLRSFTQQTLERFLVENIGTSKITISKTEKQKFTIRMARMLYSFGVDGEFEALNPEYQADSSPAIWTIPDVDGFLLLQEIRQRSKGTLNKKKLSLIELDSFLKKNNIKSLSEMKPSQIIDFCINVSDNLNRRYNIACHIRQYFQYLFETKILSERFDLFVPKFRRIRNQKVPLVLTGEEIKKAINKIDRSSATGKRAYAMFLLIISTGLRVSDIKNLKLENLDWENDRIQLVQTKTKQPISLKLFPAAGNAVWDWLQNARPKSDSQEVFLSVKGRRRGQPLSTVSISNIIHDSLERADIKRLKSLEHSYGGHVLRHSLASGLLQSNVSIYEIKELLGHKQIQSTMIYLSVDEKRLRLCSLEIPEVNSIYYKK